MNEDEYDAWRESLCLASYTTGGADPYGTECNRERGHNGSHRGDDPFGGDGFVLWTGGGSIAGDPVPPRNVQFYNADGTPRSARGMSA